MVARANHVMRALVRGETISAHVAAEPLAVFGPIAENLRSIRIVLRNSTQYNRV